MGTSNAKARVLARTARLVEAVTVAAEKAKALATAAVVTVVAAAVAEVATEAALVTTAAVVSATTFVARRERAVGTLAREAESRRGGETRGLAKVRCARYLSL